MTSTRSRLPRAARSLLLAGLIGAGLAGCAPLIIGGAMVGGGLVVTDRRTTGTQLEDESIELKAAARVRAVENVKTVVNELGIGGNSSVGSRSNDSLLSGRVKGAMVDAKDLQANAFKVVTERGIVYLMGRVTEREATRAAELARAVPGVLKVVRVFEMLSEEELARLGTGNAAAPAAPK